MRCGTLLAALVLLCLVASAALAVRPDEMLADPALEARAREISRGIRCMVCQSENIDDSEADLAHDLRVIVRERLKAGDTDDEVRQYLVARYGDFILMKPPLKPSTWLLWFGPAAILIVAALGIAVAVRRRPRTAPAPPARRG
ncbi:MAG: cytochrome c-type biogenesis protein CcmH, partial [Rhodospirillaceae bacterium]|nr:cytochrome c-type biogenesis protein CcmH [Rhodospirillaceae bacterium]